MDPVVAAALASWNFSPGVVLVLTATAVVYVRGWRALHRQMPHRFGAWQLAAFLAGLATIIVAIASPLDAFGGLLLQIHMTQHLLLMMVAPPLIWLGAPGAPLMRGLPLAVLKHGVGPFLTWPALQRCGRLLTHPIVCWLAFVAALWVWHVPALYELALRSPTWHQVEHVSFLLTALLFWWPVIQPWPSAPLWPRWAMIPYLLLADVQNTIFSALFAFTERLIYPAYAAAPRLWGISPLDDQAAAGAIMWVPGSISFLVPLGWVITELLSAQPQRESAVHLGSNESSTVRAEALEARSSRRPWDLLTVPVVGPLLRWRHLRRALQTLMLLAAVAVVVDGLLGPQMSPMNLAGVLPWTYWRGLGVVALLVAGNVFCMACPFMLPRDLGRRWLPARWRWPKPLRSKWLAVGLLLLYLWAYEAFGLWDVLVQQYDTNEPVLDAEVSVSLAPMNTASAAITGTATRQQATNKLLYAAAVNVPSAGSWQLHVTVHQGFTTARAAGTITAAVALPPLLAQWPYLAFPPVAVMIFALHQWLRSRSSNAS